MPSLKPLRQLSVWVALGWFDLAQSYRRTVLGPWWYTLNVAIWTFAMTIVYGALFGVPTIEYASYVLAGMIGWQWLSSVIAEGGSVFINQAHHVRNPDIDNDVLIWATAFRYFAIFLHQVVLVLLFILAGFIELGLAHLLLIPMSLAMFFLSVPIVTLLGLVFTRFRDVQKLANASLIIFLMITPIFWKREMLSGWRATFVDSNPFYHFIDFIRRPLLGEVPEALSVVVVLITYIVLWLFSAVALRRYGRQIVFWI